MAVNVVSSRSSDAQPEPWGPLCWVLAFFTASYQHLLWTPIHQVSRGPLRPGVAFLTTPRLQLRPIFNSTANCPQLNWQLFSDSNSTELYNGSTPTRSLKSHVWSSSSGNNCHAVHGSLSSGASVYECTMGIFLLVPFHQPISAHAISSPNCHWNVSLPSGASPWMAFWAGSKGQNTTNAWNSNSCLNWIIGITKQYFEPFDCV